MRCLVLIIATFAATMFPAHAQSHGIQSRSPECKRGNLMSEKDPSTIALMERFLNDLKSAVAGGEKKRVATLAKYPLSFSTADQKVIIRSEQELVEKYDQIFVPELKALLLTQTKECIGRVGAKGFTIGSGQIWFDKVPDGKVKMFGITAVVYPDD
jgi:hypothetical protein